VRRRAVSVVVGVIVTTLDWLVALGTILLIVGYGLWKERKAVDGERYLTGGRDMRWYTVGLSVMATQASAITFLSLPGQAFEDGLGFVQFYFGLPVAMVLLSAVALPLYVGLKVTTAYEYLEQRFDQKTRQLTAFLFLLSRGLASGVSLSAPAIVLAVVLGWPLKMTTLALGLLVIIYTVFGGTRVVSRTQTYQMVVMLTGMFIAAVVAYTKMSSQLSFGQVFEVAGTLNKLNAVDFSLRLDTRYTFWSGMTGGLFVALAYFGTDQSQVQRYLAGASLTESRLGLMFNALVKVPMQALILFVGVLVFVFFQFERPPVYFDESRWQQLDASKRTSIESRWAQNFEHKKSLLQTALASDEEATAPLKAQLMKDDVDAKQLRSEAKKLVADASPTHEAKDSDFVFLWFVLKQFPKGLVGLLVAVILSAAMSATAAALNALGSTSVVDFYRRSLRPQAGSDEILWAARGFTVFWGLVAVLFATFASGADNLIQAVNVLGSIFYGPMLGVFLVGFFLPFVRGSAAFTGVVLAQALVLAVWLTSSIGFLWYNVIGCAAVVLLSLSIQGIVNFFGPRATTSS
jgi:solute:Na+ symporter, SSS family